MSDAMNAEEMIEIVLCKAEVPSASGYERALPRDPEQAARLERLRRAVHRLLDDGSEFEHPPDLARRTRRVRRAESAAPDDPARPRGDPRLPFRWADFAVAASIFIAGTLTLLPAIQRSRERMNQAGCVFNLQQLGNSLAQYASLHPFLPYPPSHRSDTHAGMFAVMLHDAGVLDNLSLLDCPCNGACPHVTKELASFEQVDQIRRDRSRGLSADALLGLCLQRRLSSRVSGHAGPLEVAHSSRIPVLADQPDHEDFQTIREGNSPNHGRRGQNVLFGDGSVRWFRLAEHRSRTIRTSISTTTGSRDPASTCQDSVLMPSKIPFQGR